MAKEKKPVEVPAESVDNVLVDVEYAAGECNMTFYGPGFRVEFVNGKASVFPQIAEFLKEAQLVK